MTDDQSNGDNLSRREFSKLTMAALGGMALGAGAGVANLGLTGSASAATALLADKNVCRGLNTCKNHKGGKNDCAGTGSCATAAAHGCNGENACKGQGGCGEHPGENACKGKGQCNVPLNDGAWKKCRAHFEEVMKAAGKKFGPAPAK
ncbi:MAG: hypothetical protein K8T25_03875 [Planctomycetia bacterium]|nr:hypothetical protein [Planctomycetia bacterium]